ncbi:MAG: peptidoglycan-binding protein [Clostridia bacterium]|nr:peptidoglycan-binding protein [Clostridia bacterium]MBQ7317112.1 peptidoglycan-binding protein [Clostridia bacterium]
MTSPGLPIIPETVTVHLGAPSASAPNVTVPFADYIANVASSEIYPTWPESAIRANIYAQISYTLNRIYTEFYRSRGYDFDITNSIANDQSFVNGREIFSNVQEIVDEIFNDYIRRRGTVEPLFAQYCDGVEVTCPGLSQWGTVTLANQGLTPYEILQNYYGNDIDLVQNAPVGSVSASAPSSPLRLGSFGEDVRLLQIRLNRISNNYSGIPKIAQTDGVFTYDTEAAVKAFQEIFDLTPDGIVGNATWYAILRIYNAVKRLNSLNSEGLQFEELPREYTTALSEGDRGQGVAIVQYYIDYLAAYYDTIPALEIDGVYGNATRNAVLAVQRTFGLSEDGILGEATWRAIVNAYNGIISRIPVVFTEGNIIPYQGIVLRQGAETETVRILQSYLDYISQSIPEIPPVSPTGYFGPRTQQAVEAFQRLYGLPVTGYVEAITWDRIADLYSDLYVGSRLGEGQYPGSIQG